MFPKEAPAIPSDASLWPLAFRFSTSPFTSIHQLPLSPCQSGPHPRARTATLPPPRPRRTAGRGGERRSRSCGALGSLRSPGKFARTSRGRRERPFRFWRAGEREHISQTPKTTNCTQITMVRKEPLFRNTSEITSFKRDDVMDQNG